MSGEKMGTNDCAAGEGGRLTLSQSMSTNIMVTVQLSPASTGGGD